jgi:hypothetical protein
LSHSVEATASESAQPAKCARDSAYALLIYVFIANFHLKQGHHMRLDRYDWFEGSATLRWRTAGDYKR